MNDLANILAKSGLESLIEVLGFVAIMVIIGVVQLVAKRKKDRQQREEQQRDVLGSRKPLGQAGDDARQRSDFERPMTSRGEPAEQPAYGLPALQRPQAAPQRRVVRRDLRQPRVAASMPIIVTEPEDEGVEQVVEEELRHEQQRLAREEAERRRRMAEPKPQVARRRSVVSIRPKVKPTMAATVAGEVERRVAVDLTNADAARRAIIYHEIFSGPKALRTEAEAWEL